MNNKNQGTKNKRIKLNQVQIKTLGKDRAAELIAHVATLSNYELVWGFDRTAFDGFKLECLDRAYEASSIKTVEKYIYKSEILYRLDQAQRANEATQ